MRGQQPLRVLLLSPVAERDPAGGDVTYTDVLLSHPPPGVTYTAYNEAIDEGTLRLLGGRPRRRDQLGPPDVITFAASRAHRLLAGRVAFREPPYFARITAGAFDVVHQHLFGVRVLGTTTPVVMTSGRPLGELYRVREGWGASRVGRAEALLRWEARALGMRVPGVSAGPHAINCVFTERYAQHVQRETGRPARVVRQAVPVHRPHRPAHPRTAAFLGGEWQRKGGPAALALITYLLEAGIVERGLVITRKPSEVKLPARPHPGLVVLPLQSHSQVLDHVLPTTDLLVQPTTSDCGAPFTILEALAAGTRVLLSRNPWLDEGLEGASVALSTLAPDALRSAAVGLLANPEVDAQRHRSELLGTRFSLNQLHAGLRQAYDDVIHGRG